MEIELLNQKDLATAMNVSKDWIRAMCREGFPMPGGRSTVSKAMAWLDKHPDFKVSASLNKKKARRK